MCLQWSLYIAQKCVCVLHAHKYMGACAFVTLHAEVKEGCQVSLLFPPYSLGGSLTELETHHLCSAAWLASFQGPTVSDLECQGDRHMQPRPLLL